MGYIVTRSFYEGDTLHSQGSAFNHDDSEIVKKALADGNIAEEGSQPTVQNPPHTEVQAAQEATAPEVPLDSVSPISLESEELTVPTPEQIQQDIANIQ